MAAILSMLPKRKGRAGSQDGRHVLRLFPYGRSGRVFIYAIAFKGDVVKVGQTKSPRQRLLAHWKTGSGEVEWVHVFESMHAQTANVVERLAPDALRGIANQVNGSEWFFASVPKADVVSAIRGLIRKSKDDVEAGWAKQEQSKRQIEAIAKLLREHGLLPNLDRA